VDGLGGKRRDYFCFVFRADAYRGTPHESSDEGTPEWVPIEDLASRPMWDSDHRWLPMVFDQDPQPFYGVMPYDGYEMLRACEEITFR
jgi:8-oxo-dGTP diphosphatase